MNGALLVATVKTSLKVNYHATLIAAVGIALGVAGIVYLTLMVPTYSHSLTKNFDTLSEQYIKVFPNREDGTMIKPALSIHDANTLLTVNKSIAELAVAASGETHILLNGEYLDSAINGISENYFDVHPTSLLSKDQLTIWNSEHEQNLALINKPLLRLLPECNLLPQCDLLLQDTMFSVVGIHASVSTSPYVARPTPSLIVPYRNFAQLEIGNMSLGIEMRVIPSANVELTRRQIEEYLNQTRQIEHPEEGFLVLSKVQLQERAMSKAKREQGLLAVISLVALLVGEVGCMNMMLSLVSQQRREISHRLLLGELSGQVKRHFIVNTASVSLMFGIIGAILGLIISRIMVYFSPELEPLKIGLWVFLPALALSCLLSLIFGIYPALKATELNPKEI